ncbi:MAG: hypothetical protein JWQ31_2182, partial [Mycobacterium sp.]|nr:hypothetical protein [Mycobacterium sp.]
MALGEPSRSRRNAFGHGVDSRVRRRCVLAETVGVRRTIGNDGVQDGAESRTAHGLHRP